jgi:phage terminase small subunit
MPRTRDPLSVKERAFIRHYLAGQPGIRGNATRAYVAAGYAPRGARQSAWVLLRKPRLAGAIAAYHARAGITITRVLEELRRLAFSDMREVASWGGFDGVKLKMSDTLTDEAASAIAEVVDHTKSRLELGSDTRPAAEVLDRQVRVKLHDKLAALTLLAKHLGLLKESEEQRERPLFPKGFFAALITGDVSKLEME